MLQIGSAWRWRGVRIVGSQVGSGKQLLQTGSRSDDLPHAPSIGSIGAVRHVRRTSPMAQLIAGNWKMHGLAPSDGAGARRCAAGGRARVRTPGMPAGGACGGGGRGAGGFFCRGGGPGLPPGEAGRPHRRYLRTDAARCGPSWVILGHSERRQDHGETDELIREKVLAAVEPGCPHRLRWRNRGSSRRWTGDRGGRLADRRQPAASRLLA